MTGDECQRFMRLGVPSRGGTAVRPCDKKPAKYHVGERAIRTADWRPRRRPAAVRSRNRRFAIKHCRPLQPR
ncbi:hypothetical protein KL86PLE_40881 [uncultured Pleomorphomonas sp.]|uniref:Uncharacterized protein n=1 Tax=uncultured Pleomorphomonas sp. TaxID=442121 RepID=A0A212LHN8_9HYPH|nr:hypothetical protein KL86PLE_40881 [uncultured Pleomorphomonas sp.]